MKKGSLKRRSSKMILTLVLAFVLCLGSAISSFAISGEWKQDSTGWYYIDTAGYYPKNTTVRLKNDFRSYVITKRRTQLWVAQKKR